MQILRKAAVGSIVPDNSYIFWVDTKNPESPELKVKVKGKWTNVGNTSKYWSNIKRYSSESQIPAEEKTDGNIFLIGEQPTESQILVYWNEQPVYFQNNYELEEQFFKKVYIDIEDILEEDPVVPYPRSLIGNPDYAKIIVTELPEYGFDDDWRAILIPYGALENISEEYTKYKWAGTSFAYDNISENYIELYIELVLYEDHERDDIFSPASVLVYDLTNKTIVINENIQYNPPSGGEEEGLIEVVEELPLTPEEDVVDEILDDTDE